MSSSNLKNVAGADGQMEKKGEKKNKHHRKNRTSKQTIAKNPVESRPLSTLSLVQNFLVEHRRTQQMHYLVCPKCTRGEGPGERVQSTADCYQLSLALDVVSLISPSRMARYTDGASNIIRRLMAAFRPERLERIRPWFASDIPSSLSYGGIIVCRSCGNEFSSKAL
mgnify:CR=1 FL=1